MNSTNPFPYLQPPDEAPAAPEPISQGTEATTGNDNAAADEVFDDDAELRDATDDWVLPDPALLPTMLTTPLARTRGQTQRLLATRMTTAATEGAAAAPRDTPKTEAT
jgi:hypothetical protein